ncbi:MAG: glycosyltransferase family 2 protein [Nitriliruptoraceae bacterium]
MSTISTGSDDTAADAPPVPAAEAPPVPAADAPAVPAAATSGDGAVGAPRRPDVSIILPAYNELGHLDVEVARITASMDASQYTWEIIAVDDCSSDGTRERLRELAATDERIRLFEHRRNLGSGGARRTGTRASRGRFVVWTDVDMTYPNDRIPWLVDQLGEDDQLVGARTTEEGTHKFARVPAKWAVRRLAQYLTQQEIPDLNSGFRVFRREQAVRFLHQLPNGFSCVTTMTMSFMSDGLSVSYVDIPYAARKGESKFHWYRDTRKYLLQVVRMILGYEPLRVFMPLGLMLLFFGLGKLGYDFVTKDLRLATNTLLILFAAFQVISIGLLADLVVRVSKPQVRDPLEPERGR